MTVSAPLNPEIPSSPSYGDQPITGRQAVDRRHGVTEHLFFTLVFTLGAVVTPRPRTTRTWPSVMRFVSG